MIEIVNVHHMSVQDFAQPGFVYIGRRSADHAASPLANPFRITTWDSREDVVKMYRDWLRTEYMKREIVYAELWNLVTRSRRAEHLRLGCWCAPALCHGDVIRNAVERLSQT